MKKIFILSLWASMHCAAAQPGEVSPIANGYHVVVSTFNERQEKEARLHSHSLNKRGFTSGYGLEKGKHFIYVFLQSFDFDH